MNGHIIKVTSCQNSGAGSVHTCTCEEDIVTIKMNHRILSQSMNVYRVTHIDKNNLEIMPENMDVQEDLTGQTLANLGEPIIHFTDRGKSREYDE